LDVGPQKKFQTPSGTFSPGLHPTQRTAVKTVEPALTKFYDLLSDEQKARFNTLRAVDRSQG
jgi:LTXXQ motif family protein